MNALHQRYYDMNYNFKEHIKGDTFLPVEFQIKDGGSPKNLTDYRIRMHLRRSSTQTSPLVFAFDTDDGTIDIFDAADGKFRLTERVIDIPAFDYRYDIEFTSPAGVVRTWIRGVFPVKPEVTYDNS